MTWSLSRGGAHHGARSAERPRRTVSLVLRQPAVRLLEGQVDQPVVRAVADDLLEQAAGDRR